MFTVVNGGRADSNELLDIDIKCFDDPWSPEGWARITGSTDHGIVVARYYGTAIGFAVYTVSGKSVHLVRWCVKNSMRRKGASRQMLSKVFDHANLRQLKDVFVITRESLIYPDAPVSVSKYLTHMGFVATKPFIPAYFSDEAGVKFVAPASATFRE